MKILAFESSCDDTSVAFYDSEKDFEYVKSVSQIEIHSEWGGVVPELASRKHYAVMPFLLEELEKNVPLDGVELIAATYGPGLAGSLLIGLSFAKAFALSRKKKFIGINHLYGHLAVNFDYLDFPAMGMIISGGHTSLYYLESPYKIVEIGKTIDDAVGEAFDKVAKLLGLPYPGGPHIEKTAREGKVVVDFPIGLQKKDTLNFSFSGLKTAVKNFYQKNETVSKEDLCASFQEAVVKTLLFKIKLALKKYPQTKSFFIGGGVAANSYIRDALRKYSFKRGIYFFAPPKNLCVDNALMIAKAAFYKAKINLFDSVLSVDINPSLKELV